MLADTFLPSIVLGWLTKVKEASSFLPGKLLASFFRQKIKKQLIRSNFPISGPFR